MRLLLPAFRSAGSHHLNAPYAVLSGFAIELAFKAVLRARGYDDDALRGLSHNLSAAHDAAIAAGFISSDPQALSSLVGKMQDPHANFLLRYIPAGVDKISLPRPEEALATLDMLCADVEAQVPEILEQMPG